MIRITMRRAMLLAFLLLPGAASASPIELVVFGDSLSDTGNVFGLTGGAIPPSPPYFAGRYSNGPVWLDQLAAKRGLGPVNSAFVSGGLTGVVDNFAAGGAYASSYAFPPPAGGGTSFNANDLLLGAPVLPGLATQVGTYAAMLGGGPASPDAWHVLWAGANDLVFADVNGTTADAVAASAAAGVAAAVAGLAGLGATEFLVANLPDIGLSPFGIGTGRTAELSAGVSIFNAELAALLAGLEGTLGIDIMLFDTFTLFAELGAAVLADPVAAGFPGGFGPCLPPNVLCPAGSDPNDFVFWDALHPSSRTHGLITRAILDAKGIPEPGTLLLVSLAVAGLGVRKRRN